MEGPTVVIDNGAGYMKAGFCEQDLPTCVFPAMVGKLKHPDLLPDSSVDQFIGDDTLDKLGVLNIQRPFERGCVVNYDALEDLWRYAFETRLHVCLEASAMLITDPSPGMTINRERMAQILFESFNIPSLYISAPSALSLYACGKTTGLVLDVGHAYAVSSPIYEGYALPHANCTDEFAGAALTKYFATLVSENGYTFASTGEHEIARDMKEKLTYVSLDYEQELLTHSNSAGIDKAYELPDGHILMVGNEQFRCPEALFNPELVGREGAGIHGMVATSIAKCDIDVRRDLWRNVVLSGGTTMIPGFAERLSKQLSYLTPPQTEVRVTADPNRQYAVWIGGSVLASLSSFESNWISRDDYDERGSFVVNYP